MLATASRHVEPVSRGRAKISVTDDEGYPVVTVTGDIDLSCTALLRARLDEQLRARPEALVVDLTAVAFCSSGGLSVLLDIVTSAHAHGIPCAVIATRRGVLRPIRLLHLDRVLPVYRDRAEALVTVPRPR